MATKRAIASDNTEIKAAVAEAVNDMLADDQEPAPVNPALESLYAELGIESLGEEVKIFVYQLNADGKGNEAQIWRGAPEDYDLEALGKIFGSGQYRIKIYEKREGKSVVAAGKIVGIKLSPADEARRLAPLQPQPQQAPVDIARAISDGVAQAMRSMPPPAPATNLGEIIALAKAMMPPPAPQINPFEMLKLGADMAKQSAEAAGPREPGSNTNDLIISMIENFGAPVVNLVTAAQQKVQQLPVQAPQLENQAPLVENPQQPYNAEIQAQPEQDVNLLAELKLKAGLSFLVTQAAAGNPVETYAEMIVDNVTPEDLQQVMSQPDPVAALANFNVDINKYPAWFKELLDNVKTLLTEPPAAA